MLFENHQRTLCYAHTPKCASRTVLAWLALCEDPGLLVETPQAFFPSRHKSEGEYAALRRRAHMVGMAGNQHHFNTGRLPMVPHPLRVGIVRDPVERFVSGYRNRVLFHGAGGGAEALPTLETFIERIDELEATDPDIQQHFRPQWHFLGSDVHWFTHLYPLGRINDLRQLLQRLHGVELPALRLQVSEGTPPVAVSAEARAWIQQRYAIDSELFGRFLPVPTFDDFQHRKELTP